MRLSIVAAVAMLLAACAQTGETIPAPPGNTQARRINSAKIKRVGGELPAGYEVTAIPDTPDPPAIWGLGGGWTADPARCAVLADPADRQGLSAQGISGSGAGGIVFAVVVAAPRGPVALDPTVVAGCRHWSMSNGRATARIHLIEPPRIDGVQTLGMATDTTTSVEGGNEIVSRAITFTAYLGDYYAFTSLISDPGASHPPLPPQFASDLLVKSVSALRS
jgi:hypothetical protein